MKKIFFSILISFLCYTNLSAQEIQPTVEIAFVGDILLARGVEKKIEKFGTNYPFANVKNILSSADIAVGNLENPITNECEKIDKKYAFQAKPKYTKILRSSGLDILSLANNHSLDCGEKGLMETFKNLQNENLAWIGAGKSINETEALKIIKKKGIKFAFLGFTTISPYPNRKDFNNVSFATPKKVKRLVQLAQKKSDVVIVSFHWGTEYHTSPNLQQKELARIAINAGADAILGHHPHVLQEINLINKTSRNRKAIIAYSLGNFVFDSPVRLDRRLHESVILKMQFGKSGLIETEAIPIKIENFRPVIADESTSKRILSRLKFPSNNPKPFKKQIEVDLDSDGKLESIVLDSKYPKSLQIRQNAKLKWQGVPAKWKPWKLDIADVDGDGVKEIVIGVFKSTKFFSKPHNCLFIYGWNGKKAFPKWLGSSLSRPFTEFMFADLDNQKGDELIAMETTLKGKKSISVYKWNGFGFTVEWRQGDWDTAKILDIENGQISVKANGEKILIDEFKTR